MMPTKNRLMPNYGWVQNTSNLSTIRDTIDLVPDHGIPHSELRIAIRDFRKRHRNLPKRWEWDARCRIKAIHALGLVKLDRYIDGYDLTDLGREVQRAPKSKEHAKGLRKLSPEEIELFKIGLLTNPPVIRVLDLLNESRRKLSEGLSKYDIGKELGFVGDVGFTHIDPFWVVKKGFTFNNKEGDADKWARTIISWLEQVGWVVKSGSKKINGVSLQLYKATDEVENILRYDASRIVRNVPAEMLCSYHHAFPKLVQKRRSIILHALSLDAQTKNDLVSKLDEQEIQADAQTCEFEVLNLRLAGFRITESGGYYKLIDKIALDVPTIDVPSSQKPAFIDELIQSEVLEYKDTIPQKFIDHLIRYGYSNSYPREFEIIVAEYLRHLGYEADYLGQGKGRVTDILAKYRHPSIYAKSYGLIIDAKATSDSYSFPAGDKRKMKEYINRHGPRLNQENIPNHAFSFISSKFVADVTAHIQEIAVDTSIKGCAITVLILLELGRRISKQQLSIAGIYNLFTSNGALNLP